jgi:tetratricopeptide (TPR) repeat protein
MQLATRCNESEEFERALDICKQLLQMDSTNYNAMRTAADVLWKMNRFDEAMPYAQRGIELLQAAIEEREAKGGVAWYHDGQEYIDKLQFFIDKCQRREKWKWAK